MGDVAPDHLPAMQVSLFPKAMAAAFVAQKSADFLGNCLGITKRHENAATVRQQLLRVPVGSRNHRFAATESISEGAGGDLRLVEVRRHVNVGGRQEFLEFAQFHEAVIKDD